MILYYAFLYYTILDVTSPLKVRGARGVMNSKNPTNPTNSMN
jgi:hypothetical protein